MNEGKKFEEQFKKSLIKDNFHVLRLPDPPQSFNQNDTLLRFSNTNPYDFQVYKKPNLFCLELKSNNSTSFSIQFDKQEKGKDIKIHQINGLSESSKFEGITSGFILNFRKVDRTYFLDIKNFEDFLKSTSKKSINETDVICSKGILIPQILIRIKYHYDFLSIVERLKNA